MRSIVLACLVGGLGGMAACLVELPREVACGDGYVDASAGEECDPGDADSYAFACGGQGGSCHPETCKLECCGDRVVNGDEECDGPDLGFVGPGGDPAGGDNCRSLTVPGTGVPFAGGTATCTSECRYDLSRCTLCGNGQIDREVVYTDGTVLPAEVCEGDVFRPEELSEICAPLCGLPSTAEVGCNASCNGCRLITVGEPLDCCTLPGRPQNPVLPCCCQFDPRGCALDVTEEEQNAEPVCPEVRES